MTTKTIDRPKKQTYAEENVGNIMLLEHVNVQVPDQQTAMLFYLVGMGFTRDPHMMVGLENMWVNLGEQQFHLPTAPAQVLRGHIGIVTPSIDELEARLEGVAPRLAGTKFAYAREDGYLAVTCPWGNQFRCYEPAAEFGNIQAGIPYIEFTVPRGAAEGIAMFYEKGMETPAQVVKEPDGKTAIIDIGQYQHLIFREADDVPAYDGHHFAVYVADFAGPHRFLSERELVTENPLNHQFRFKDIVHPKTGEPLFTIEHEVRGLRHPLYRRPLVNRTVGQFAEPRRVGNSTILGRVM